MTEIELKIDKANLLIGDCLEVMKSLPENSIDSVVTDPPSGIAFMAKDWDDFGGLKGFQDFICSVFLEVYRILKPGGHCLVWAIPRTSHHTAMGIERAGFEIRDRISHVFGSGFPKSLNISKALDKLAGAKREPILDKDGNQVWTSQKQGKKSMFDGGKERPATYPATYYNGFGTALKPAMEDWWLCRKPLSEKTVAENVLKWGTGGINIDGCRLGGVPDSSSWFANRTVSKTFHGQFNDNTLKGKAYKENQGRFPANFIHDGSEEVTGLFPNKSHRFFYSPKASKGERNEGLEGFEAKRHADRNKDDGSGGDNPRNRTNTPKVNFHPTVKPVKLMEYLCRLITPKNGIVLDPFMGSGTTGIAAANEGFRFVGIEREPDYFKIASARIEAAITEKEKTHQQGNLFEGEAAS